MRAFRWLYALAWAGGAVAYVPFLTILLPIRVAAMVGEQRVEWLAYMTFFGAIAASLGGVGFGWLSDRTGARRPWIIAGLIGTLILMLCVPLARGPAQLLVLIIVWQLALNMMLGPLSAWAADHVPEDQLGVFGGLLALSPALGSAAGALVTIPGLADPDQSLALVGLLVAACVIPALVFARPADRASASTGTRPADAFAARLGPAARAMWFARLLVQICEATLFAYLYYFFRSIDPSRDASWIARLFSIVVCTAVPAALLIGRWSDRRSRPISPLIVAALALSLALVTLAVARSPTQATAAYVVFGFATTIFLSLHSAQTLRVLVRPDHRGRDLGVFNLTNTAPSLIMPWLTIAIVPEFGFSSMFLLLAALALAAAVILFAAARRLSVTARTALPAHG
ncbi:MFS family permease [Sphingomonas sp. F9_3S_D5_B_2]